MSGLTEEQRVLYNQLKNAIGDFVEGFAKGFNDKMKEKHEIETKQVTNKAIGIGIIFGVIAALVIGGGCGVAGAQLSILAIAGIAAALAVGLVAGGITYAISKPSNKLDELNLNKEQASAAHSRY
ncbi:hypothetical protein [Wolbachia endosymbiont of Zygogramma bicolorata]|uniref:hypothetical protein n=1 Tax=Wolbachia endosymbiont of Zygogramma bicolorata TaxID=3134048 RepID=UPI003DA9CC9B